MARQEMNGGDVYAESLRLENDGQLNSAVQPLLTDFYQITMAYAYWKSNKHDNAVFDLFFRKNPFHSEFTVFSGLTECLKYLRDFRFTQSDIDYLKTVLPPHVEEEFFTYLKNLNLDDITLHAIAEGSIVFPRIPLIRVEGPIIKVQLLETTLLVLVNFASLVTTNAVRFRLAAGPEKTLFEFGLRRAQGPDGGLTASKYCYIGGFDATSNVLAGKLYGIPVRGTNAHSFVSSFRSLEDVKIRTIKATNGETVDFIDACQVYLGKVTKLFHLPDDQANIGELCAFAAYAIAFPNSFLVLVDTYHVLNSGLVNFCAVALALNSVGYRPSGVRLDSGDLAYLSKEVRDRFKTIADTFNLDWFNHLTVVASNDIDEEVLYSLNAQKHSIDTFGIGTHLVTCKKQPALGCVYKLVEVHGSACMKLSEDPEKITFPGKKDVYRLYDQNGVATMDLMTKYGEKAPEVGEKYLCRHPFIPTKRAYITSSRVENLYKLYWSNGKIVEENIDTLQAIRDRVTGQIKNLRDDHKRQLNPTPYKITVSPTLYEFIHDLWIKNVPIGEI